MEPESPPPSSSSSSSTSQAEQQQQQRRQICGHCERPKPVCLCHVIPTTPIITSTHILIVHHPLESQHKLNTARLLSKTLHHVTTHLSRKLLRSHLTHTHQSPSSTTIYLFPPSPGSPAVGLSEFKQSLNSDVRNLRLVVFDGTWKHAKEMVKASQGVLEGFGAIRVCLDLDVDENSRGETIYNDELLLRKEPFKGCVTTFEAVARCLRVVEPDNGEEIERILIGILREMVKLQAAFLKPVKPRPKLLKISKQNQFKTS
ncbi:hypothetical protein Dsin_009663 [Dipteronia sinensis]|uniref:tRNA-uridine aminocarboxypropyltransferase n=1 Tax=Dipteronia sinensis TaxID=43782 RepID=A0AAE0EBU8_9ROSI|nr:hypothetical protein Dsin_009663 [Dipteronia sinensis]